MKKFKFGLKKLNKIEKISSWKFRKILWKILDPGRKFNFCNYGCRWLESDADSSTYKTAEKTDYEMELTPAKLIFSWTLPPAFFRLCRKKRHLFPGSHP